MTNELNEHRNPAAFAIILGGGLAGAFDITYAIVFSALRSNAFMPPKIDKAFGTWCSQFSPTSQRA